MIKTACLIWGVVLMAQPSLLSGQTTSHLYIPTLQASDAANIGIALLNPTLDSKNVILTARTYTGQTIVGSGITNPRSLTIDPMNQTALQATDVFGPGIANRVGWIDIDVSVAQGMQCLYLLYDSKLDYEDGSPALVPSERLVFPRVTASTRLSFVNIGNDSLPGFNITLYRSDGTIAQTLPLPLDTGSGRSEILTELIQNTSDFVGYAVLDSGGPSSIIASASYQNLSDIAVTAGIPAGGLLEAGYIAQMVTGQGYSSSLALVNPSTDIQTVRISIGSLAPAVDKTIPALGSLVEPIDQLFHLDPATLNVGYVSYTITSATDGLIGSLDYTTADGALTSVAAQGGGLSDLYFAQVAEGSGYYTGLALLNPSTVDSATVTIDVSDSAGQPTGSATVTLSPSQQEAHLVHEFVPAIKSQLDGSIHITADQPIVAIELFGLSTSDAVLTNVAAQSGPPVLTAITPNTGVSPVNVVLTGQGFSPSSEVLVDGQPTAATVDSGTGIHLTLSSNQSGQKSVSVMNLPPGGGDSEGLPFVFTAGVAGEIVKISPTQPVTLDKQATIQLTVEALDLKLQPLSGASVAFSIVSGGGSIVSAATVVSDSSGFAQATVHAAAAGACVVMASSGNAQAVFVLVTSNAVSSLTILDANNVAISEIAVNVGNSVQLNLLARDATGHITPISQAVYQSESPEFATIDSNGVITGVSPGFADFSVTVDGFFVATAVVDVVGVNVSTVPGFDISNLEIAADPAGQLFLSSSTRNDLLKVTSLTDPDPAVYAGDPAGNPGYFDGSQTASQFRQPTFVAVDQGDINAGVYVADTGNKVIRLVKFTGADSTTFVTTVASGLTGPKGLALDAGFLWVADFDSIRRISVADYSVSTVTVNPTLVASWRQGGADCPALFDGLIGLALETPSVATHPGDPSRVVVIDDTGAIYRVDQNGVCETLIAAQSRISTGGARRLALAPQPRVSGVNTLRSPQAVAVDAIGNILITDPSSAEGLQMLLATVNTSGVITGYTFSPAVQQNTLGAAPPTGVAVTPNGIFLAGSSQVQQIRYGQPIITNITPDTIAAQRVSDCNTGTTASCDTVTITGKNFSSETIVIVNGQIQTVRIKNTQSLSFVLNLTTPITGLGTITIQNRGGLAQSKLFIQPTTLEALAVGQVTTFAGGSLYAGDGAAALAARFAQPNGLALDSAGNLYIADTNNQRIRQINPLTGLIGTVAGTGTNFDATVNPTQATATHIFEPQGVAVAKNGDLYYYEDGLIRKVAAGSGIVTTIASNSGSSIVVTGGTGETPAGLAAGRLAFDPSGNNLYISETQAYVVRKLNLPTMTLSTVAGVENAAGSATIVEGAAALQNLCGLNGITLDSSNLYIATACGSLLSVSLTDGTIHTAIKGLLALSGVAVDNAGHTYVSETDAAQIGCIYQFQTDTPVTISNSGSCTNRVANIPTGTVLFGNGTLATGEFRDIVVDSAGQLFVSDSSGNRILRYRADPSLACGSTVCVISGGGGLGDGDLATAAAMEIPKQMAFDSAGNLVFSDSFYSRIRKIDKTTNIISTMVAETCEAFGFTFDTAGNLFIGGLSCGTLFEIPAGTTFPAGSTDIHTVTSIGNPQQLALRPPIGLNGGNGNVDYSDVVKIREVGSGPALLEYPDPQSFALPIGLAFDSLGNMFVGQMDYSTPNISVVKVAATNQAVTLVAGAGAASTNEYIGAADTATTATLDGPNSMAVSLDDRFLYIADNNRIQRIDLNANPPTICTVAGTSNPTPGSPNGQPARSVHMYVTAVAVDSGGNIYIGVADDANAYIGRILVVKGPLSDACGP